jgi:hypothetical protein
MGKMEEMMVGATAPDKTFRLGDPLNMVFGVVEGSMSAIPSSTFNYQCGKNTTLARTYTNNMVLDFSQGETTDGMTQFNKILQIADDITINCVSAILTADTT